MKRSLIILCIAIVLSAFIYAISGIVIQQHREVINNAATGKAILEITHTSHFIEEFIRERTRVINMIASWIVPNWISSTDYRNNILTRASRLLKNYPGINSIHFLNSQGKVTWSIPKNKSLKGINLIEDLPHPKRFNVILEKARRQRHVQISPLKITRFNSLAGKLEKTDALLIVAPVYHQSIHKGTLLAIMRLDAVGKYFFPTQEVSTGQFWMFVGKGGNTFYTSIPQNTSFWTNEIPILIKKYFNKTTPKKRWGSKIISWGRGKKKTRRFMVSFAALTIIPEYRWYVAHIQSQSTISHGLKRWLFHTRLIAFTAMGIMLLSAIFMLLAFQRSEARLNILNEKYVDLLDNLMVGTFSFDKSGHIDYVNRRACEILGYAPEELLGQDKLFFAWKKDRSKVDAISRQRLSGKRKAESYRTHMVHKSGRVIDVDIYASPIHNRQGDVQGVRVMFNDITKEVEMEKKLQNYTKHLENVVKQRTHDLKESEALYRSIFETSLAIIYIHQDNRFILMNDTGMTFFGYESQEEMERADVWQTVPEGERQQRRENALRRMAGEKIPQSYESLVINKEGETRVVACNFQHITYKNEPAILAILFDMTEKKYLEAEISHAEKLKLMGHLATGVAHDFNNILSAILGRIQIFQQNPEDSKTRETCIKVVESAVEQGISTIKRIQEYTKVRQTRDISGFLPLQSLVLDALEITRYAWKDQAQKKAATIHVVQDLKKKSVLVPSELREIFLNFILNAVDAMPQGGTLTISSKTCIMENGKEGVEISFRDTGKGMSPEVIARAKEPFYTTKGGEGSGLGLSIVAGIIERLKGVFDIQSREGDGTKMIIKLPLQPPDLPAESVAGEIEPIFQPASKNETHWTILVIDDEPALLGILSDLFTPEGIEVVTANSGDEGVSLFHKQEGKFSLIMTDLGMPGMNGWEVAQEICSHNTQIPLILMTGWGLEISENEVEKAGITELVSKPFTVSKIRSIIFKYLSQTET